MTMPLALGLIDPQGGDVPLVSADATPDELAIGVFELKDAERPIVFCDVPRRPALSFLRGFSAPVSVDDDLTEDDLSSFRGTTATISTAGRRCRAWRRAAACAASRRFAPAGRPSATRTFVAAFGAFIEDARAGRIDPAFAALAMSLPSEADIAREIGEDVDPDAIYAARKRCAARSAARTATRSSRCTPSSPMLRPSAPTRPRPAGARCATARWRFRRRQRDRGSRTRAPPTRGRRQHDRTPRRAGGDCAQAGSPRASARSMRSAGATRWSR